jgi:hypothetical protein
MVSLLAGLPCFSQKEGDTWMIGYYGNGNPDYSVMELSFRNHELELSFNYDEIVHLSETSSNICTSDGRPLIWTNGMEIRGRDYIQIEDSIAYDNRFPSYWDEWYSDVNVVPYGFPMPNASLILPIPGQPNQFSVIYHLGERHPYGYWQVSKWLEARVQFDEESETFNLLYKDSLFSDYLKWYDHKINAVRHANGRDWWLVSFEEHTDRYFVYLLDPSGISEYREDYLSQAVKSGLGQGVFSRNGDVYAKMDAVDLEVGQFISIYDFDRCNGILSLKSVCNTPATIFAGLAISPSGQYLYADVNYGTLLYQWDLLSEDICSSQTYVDTFDGFIQPGWFEMNFGPMMQTPDGRIYVVPPAGSSEFMHVIERPDLPAAECRFKQHSINLTKPNGRSAPNIPNFRLGPLDGSPCDTLGLNNHPVSRWRFEEDEPGYPEKIRFTDLSFFDPQEWHWEFGDGNSSDIPSPLHTFEPGIYHVCLTVSNQYSSDSSCQWVEIIPTSIRDEILKDLPPYSFSPNPFQKEITIASRSGDFESVHLRIHDMHGRLILEQPTLTIPSRIVLPDYPPGIYLIGIENEEGGVYSEKMMKR